MTELSGPRAKQSLATQGAFRSKTIPMVTIINSNTRYARSRMTFTANPKRRRSLALRGRFNSYVMLNHSI